MINDIPLLDLKDPEFDRDFLAVCRDIGFVAIENHDISVDLLGAMESMCRRLFLLPDERKHELQIERDNYRGFIPLGFFSPNRAEVNGYRPDQYEGFKLHWECPDDHPVREACPLYGPNRWVPEIADMRRLVVPYWNACNALADRLIVPIANHLGVPIQEFVSWFSAPLTNMTLLHYPPRNPGADTSGMHPHKDTNVLTILQPHSRGGLQVRDRSGRWLEAAPEWPALVVNIGEMLELWSGGEFIATPHRAMNTTDLHRYTFPWFLVPNHDVVVKPLIECQPGYDPSVMPVGELSAEVWRTNWPDERPTDDGFDLGSLDR